MNAEKREAEALERAKEIDWDGGQLFFDGRVYDSPEEIAEQFLDGHAPEFVFATKRIEFHLDIDNALENAADEHHEDILDQLDGVDELRAAVNRFNENCGGYSLFEDTKHKIRVAPMATEAAKNAG